MRFIFCFFMVFFLASCSGKKTTTTLTSSAITNRQTLSDSIDTAIATLERRLDIKMKRKVYEAQPGNLVTLQKWFEFGDTTRLVKVREEILTSGTKMEVIQYHFLNSLLAQIHDYQYNKKCTGSGKQCMDEAKYYFANDTVKLAIQRHAEGTDASPPQIESQSFQAIQPDKSLVANKISKLTQINKKYISLPYPKPRSI